MNILAIETSCDDTGVAILKAENKKQPRFKILSNIISSQVKIHQKWGGVYPTLAKREHQKNSVPVTIEALREAKMLKISNFQFPLIAKQLQGAKRLACISKQTPNSKFQILNSLLEREPLLLKRVLPFLKRYQKPNIDLIAVTVGPGLEPCLWVGVNFARALAFWWDLPIISVNHIKAHIFANMINSGPLNANGFPAICLVVSGGHTQLILMRDFGKYKILGETRDDAAGECFDKVARILGLGYPGGPAIAERARRWRESDGELFSVTLPRPMINQKNYDFSFSGLKTAALYNFQSQPKKIRKSKEYVRTMCAEIQQAIIDVLIAKTLRAAKDHKVRSIILGGGVAANEELRKQFEKRIKKEMPDTKYLIPDTEYCTDNAAMTAISGYFRWKNGKIENWQDIKADSNLKI